jgi:hypothetical protein
MFFCVRISGVLAGFMRINVEALLGLVVRISRISLFFLAR